MKRREEGNWGREKEGTNKCLQNDHMIQAKESREPTTKCVDFLLKEGKKQKKKKKKKEKKKRKKKKKERKKERKKMKEKRKRGEKRKKKKKKKNQARNGESQNKD